MKAKTITCGEALVLAGDVRGFNQTRFEFQPGPANMGGQLVAVTHDIDEPYVIADDSEPHVGKAIARCMNASDPLARWVEAALTAKGLVDDEFRAEYQPERPGCVTMGPRVMLPSTARAMAALLLRAADHAEADR